MAAFNSSDGVALHFDDEGAGLPLLCLSGLTRNASDFDYLMPHLPPCRAIRLDYRGRGRSGWSDPASYTIPREALDVIELLDHLGLERSAVLGTSRGGLIAMMLAATAKDRLIGACLNDIGPEIAEAGLDVIKGYVGRKPPFASHAEAAAARPALMQGFANVPQERWWAEVEKLYAETPDGLELTYDPKLRDAVLAAEGQPMPDLWPLFDAFAGLPLALVRGANSDLLSVETATEMRQRRPDMLFAEVPDRAHIPFLDEPEAVAVIRQFVELCR